MNKPLKAIVLTVVLSGLALPSQAQPEGWVAPFPAFRIIGPLYGVGTLDLSVFLITTDEGHILINTGMESSTDQIRRNMESLGFRLEDVRILLTQQAHVDHTGALADIKEISGAQMWATAGDARVLEDGGLSDPHFGGEESFKPVQVDRIIQEGDIIALGGVQLKVHEHPGHTEGSSSYTMVVNEGGRDYRVGILNMGTINGGKKLLDDPTYPGVAKDFAYTYASQKAMEVDIWVAAHNSQYNMHDKYQPGQPYDPDTFVDPYGLLRAVQRLENAYQEQLAAEQRRVAYPGR